MLTALFRSRRAIRNTKPSFPWRSRHRGRRNAFSNGHEFRGTRDDLVAKLVGQFLIRLEAHAQGRGRSVISVALQLVDQIFASVVGLVVGAVLLVDQPDVIVAVYQG